MPTRASIEIGSQPDGGCPNPASARVRTRSGTPLVHRAEPATDHPTGVRARSVRTT